MISVRVFVDANVLYPRTPRDWLALLQQKSAGQLYTVYWSEDVLAETMYHLRRSNPTWSGGKITRIRDRIAGIFEGGRVEDFLIDGTFPGDDANDQHVHAAAVACNAGYLLTADRGFRHPGVDPDALPYEVCTPDDFFVLVDDNAPQVVADVTRDQAEYWMCRTQRVDLADKLHEAGCPNFARRVRHHQTQLSFSGPQPPQQPKSPARPAAQAEHV